MTIVRWEQSLGGGLGPLCFGSKQQLNIVEKKRRWIKVYEENEGRKQRRLDLFRSDVLHVTTFERDASQNGNSIFSRVTPILNLNFQHPHHGLLLRHPST